MRPDTAMILAAGFGTRMKDLTREQPKPLVRAAGKPLIDHVLDYAKSAGVTKTIINLHYRGEQIKAHLARRTDIQIAFSEEQPELLDTGGGVANALPLLGSKPFFGINSDAIFAGANPFDVLAQSWNPDAADSLLLLARRATAKAYSRAGDFFLDGTVPHRRGTAQTAPFIYAGAQILAPSALAGAPSGAFSMNLVWNQLLEKGRLAAVVYPYVWVDVGTPEGLQEASRALSG